MENELWYKKEAKSFEEALPIGNGKLGAMVYGGRETEKLSINYDELWSGKPGMGKRPGSYDVYKKAQQLVLEGETEEAQNIVEEGFTCGWDDMYLPMCDLYIEGLKGNGDYRRSLDLSTAVASVICGDTKRTYFCSKPQNTLYIKIENEPDIRIRLASSLKNDVKYSTDGAVISGESIDERIIPEESPTGKGIPYYNGAGLRFFVYMKIETDGQQEADNELRIKNASYIVIKLNAETSYADDADLEKKGHTEGYDKAYIEHIRDFSERYERVRLELCGNESDKDTSERLLKKQDNLEGLTELIFNYGRYLILSASREGSEAMNLQGIWNEKLFPPWNSNYTLNINLEMNYWPVLMCGQAECYIPLIDFIKKISIMGRQTARDMYQARGFASHHNADLWGKTNPVGNRMPGSGRYAFWNGSVGWLAAMLYEYYEYTLDEVYLENTAYPIIKEAVEFYLDIMIEHNGKYIVSPSTSPENLYIKDGKELYLARWTTMTQTIVYELFEIFISCSRLLGADAKLAEKVTKMLPDIRIFNIGSRGQLLEWDDEYEEWDVHHRHVSHLYGLYPGRTITTEHTPELADACRQTLEERGDDGTGWSLAWKANLWAKLKDGGHALKLIERQLDLADDNEKITMHGGTYLNLFDAHPPFQIDGNFGITAAIAQLFLQCENNKIKILPALPGRFANGSVKGLAAKGGITVGIKWSDMKAEEVTLKTKMPQKVTVSVNGREHICVLETDREFVLKGEDIENK